jgi:hypothetical protein
LRWRLLFLSAGEESLATLIARTGRKANAGQEVRLADFDADAGAGLGAFETLTHSKGDGRALRPRLTQPGCLARDESNYIGSPQLAELDGTAAEALSQKSLGKGHILNERSRRQCLGFTQVLPIRNDDNLNGRGIDGWSRSLLPDDTGLP